MSQIQQNQTQVQQPHQPQHLRLCKYEQYLHPITIKSPPSLKPSLPKPQPIQSSASTSDVQLHSLLSKNLLTRNYDSHKKISQQLKLQKVIPKSITIKFKQGNTEIFRKNQYHIKNQQNKKYIDIVENKIYMEYLNKSIGKNYCQYYQDDKENNIIINNNNNNNNNNQNNNSTNNQNNSNSKFDTLFNVRSIKINKKYVDPKNNQSLIYNRSNTFNNQYQINNLNQLNNKKYKKYFKKQHQTMQILQKQYPKLTNNTGQLNVKLTYHELKRITQNQRSSSSNKNKKQKHYLQPHKKTNKLSKNLSFIEQKYYQNLHTLQQQKNQSSSIYNLNPSNKPRKSTQLSPKHTQLNALMSRSSDQLNKIYLNSLLYQQNLLNINKKDYIFEEKLMRYKIMLLKTAELHNIQINFVQNYPRNQFNFYVGRGNNSQLVKEIFKKRWWLRLNQDKKNIIGKNNIIWTQLKDKMYYTVNNNNNVNSNNVNNNNNPTTNIQIKQQPLQQPTTTPKLCLHNHFQSNQFLGNKKALFYNMKFYYTSKNLNPFDYLPLTFHILNYNDNSWKQFLSYYSKSQQQSKQGKFKNIWILKPGENSNRGNGITVHQKLDSIQCIIKNQCNKVVGTNNQNINKNNQNNTNQQKQPQKPTRSFILQKYIQKPFLYNKRKFDIRCYMLLVRLNSKIKAYWYSQGYIRTSCFQFTLNDCENNKYIHLTNDAIQVNCQSYGKYQDGNKLSYDMFQKYLDMNYNNNNNTTVSNSNSKQQNDNNNQVSSNTDSNNINNNNNNTTKKYDIFRDIIPKLKSICLDSILASYSRIGKWRPNTPTFQLFGLDFMIDQSFTPWLIEINTNPCLQTSSRVLQRIIPPLLDNVYKLSIDIIFPPPLNWSNCTKHTLSKNVDINKFQLIFDQNQIDKINAMNQDNMKENNLKKQMFLKQFDHIIGKIDQDSQIYQEDQK